MITKNDYLDVLKDYLLKVYSEEESLDILRDYEEYFLNGKLEGISIHDRCAACLSGKTEEEIILELGSPKRIVQEIREEEKNISSKKGVFYNLSKKFDGWFEKGLSDKHKSGEIEIIENKCDKLFEKYGIFTFMFLAIFSIVEMFLGLHSLIGITEMLGIYVVSMSFLVRTNKGLQTKEGKLLTSVNIIFVLLLGLFAFRGTGNFLTVGFDLAFIMSIVNLILIFIFSKGIFSLVIISLICAVIFIVLGGIWFLFVGIIIFGVGLATFLTPVVLTALSTLSLNSLWIVFPIMLAIGLFIAMSILIKYYSIFIYRLVLKYNDWIKIKLMYSRVYLQKTKED